MITLVNSSENLMGLSTDVKPLNVSTNTLFLELDTKKILLFRRPRLAARWRSRGGRII